SVRSSATLTYLVFALLSTWYSPHRELHSFPTRRSSDLGWRISEESFFKQHLPDFDNVKIRGSYARVGDEGDFAAYQYLDGYQYSGGDAYCDQGVNLGVGSRGIADTWGRWYVSEIMNVRFAA